MCWQEVHSISQLLRIADVTANPHTIITHSRDAIKNTVHKSIHTFLTEHKVSCTDQGRVALTHIKLYMTRYYILLRFNVICQIIHCHAINVFPDPHKVEIVWFPAKLRILFGERVCSAPCFILHQTCITCRRRLPPTLDITLCNCGEQT